MAGGKKTGNAGILTGQDRGTFFLGGGYSASGFADLQERDRGAKKGTGVGARLATRVQRVAGGTAGRLRTFTVGVQE